MTTSVVIYGPQGCGKTRNAELFRVYFNLNHIVDEGNGAIKYPLEPTGVLYLMVDQPTPAKRKGVFLFSFAAACAVAGLRGRA